MPENIVTKALISLTCLPLIPLPSIKSTGNLNAVCDPLTNNYKDGIETKLSFQGLSSNWFIGIRNALPKIGTNAFL